MSAGERRRWGGFESRPFSSRGLSAWSSEGRILAVSTPLEWPTNRSDPCAAGVSAIWRGFESRPFRYTRCGNHNVSPGQRLFLAAAGKPTLSRSLKPSGCRVPAPGASVGARRRLCQIGSAFRPASIPRDDPPSTDAPDAGFAFLAQPSARNDPTRFGRPSPRTGPGPTASRTCRHAGAAEVTRRRSASRFRSWRRRRRDSPVTYNSAASPEPAGQPSIGSGRPSPGALRMLMPVG